MRSEAKTPDAYVDALPAERKEAVQRLRKIILKSIPKGFEETMGYGMMGYVVPHSVYPAGYHCNPKDPLPFAGLASQKNSINFYHMGIYADEQLKDWFVKKYQENYSVKLDMGKSCLRFKKPEHIPYELIGELMKKMTAKQWITLYESQLKR